MPFCSLFCRLIRELETQLEYEREKREKLESQLDRLRARVHSLTLQLEDARSEAPLVSSWFLCNLDFFLFNPRMSCVSRVGIYYF